MYSNAVSSFFLNAHHEALDSQICKVCGDQSGGKLPRQRPPCNSSLPGRWSLRLVGPIQRHAWRKANEFQDCRICALSRIVCYAELRDRYPRDKLKLMNTVISEAKMLEDNMSMILTLRAKMIENTWITSTVGISEAI